MTKEEAYRLLDWVSGEIYDQVFYEYDPYEWTEEEYKALIMAIKTLQSEQSDRKSGKWEEVEVIADAYDISGVKTWASKMKCDQCGFTTIAIEGRFSQYNFCPSCGADMRGEEE